MTESSAPSARQPTEQAPGQGPWPSLVRVKRRVLGLVVSLALGLGLAFGVGAAPGSSLLLLAAVLLLLGAALVFTWRAILPDLDALERTRLELDARYATALGEARETNDYLRDVSHEVRASMHAVLGLTQLLSRSALDATQHRQTRTIDGAARALLRIINDLLSLSGPNPHRFDLVPMGCSLHDMLRVSADLLEPSAKDKGLALELHVAIDLPDRVLIDQGRVQQVVLGVCRHAIQTFERGPIRVEARARNASGKRFELSLCVGVAPAAAIPAAAPAADTAAPAAASRDGHGVESAAASHASDSGAGSSQNSERPTSSNPASSNPASDGASSTGQTRTRVPAKRASDTAPAEPSPSSVAALSLSKRLAALMGGSIELGEPRGTIELRLPMPRIDGIPEIDRGLRPSLLPMPVRLPATTLPILVVESDERALVLAVELLENLGFEVEVASGAERVLDRANERGFALILLATELPAPGGYAAAKALRAALGARRPAIVGCTNEPLGSVRERPEAAEFDAWLPKPLDRTALCTILAEWLPDDTNPASSGTRLSQSGALERATRRAAARRSLPPASPLPDLAPGQRSERPLELLVLEAPSIVRGLARAAARGQRDEVAALAERLAERCSRSGALKLAALCHGLSGARHLSLEQLALQVKALGKALESLLARLGEPAPAAEGSPASATTDRNPDAP